MREEHKKTRSKEDCFGFANEEKICQDEPLKELVTVVLYVCFEVECVENSVGSNAEVG